MAIGDIRNYTGAPIVADIVALFLSLSLSQRERGIFYIFVIARRVKLCLESVQFSLIYWFMKGRFDKRITILSGRFILI